MCFGFGNKSFFACGLATLGLALVCIIGFVKMLVSFQSFWLCLQYFSQDLLVKRVLVNQWLFSFIIDIIQPSNSVRGFVDKLRPGWCQVVYSCTAQCSSVQNIMPKLSNPHKKQGSCNTIFSENLTFSLKKCPRNKVMTIENHRAIVSEFTFTNLGFRTNKRGSCLQLHYENLNLS